MEENDPAGKTPGVSGAVPKTVSAAEVFRGGEARSLLLLLAGLALFITAARFIYRRTSAPPPAPSAPAAPIPAAPSPAPVEPPAQPAPAGLAPLKRGVAAVEKKYGKGMRLQGDTPIAEGSLKGGFVRSYKVGSGSDVLTASGDALYRRSLTFLVKEIDQKKEDFAALVYILALYPAAYDAEFGPEGAPEEVRAKAFMFGARCAALMGNPGHEHYAVDGDYVFGCINEGDERLRFEAVSAGLFREEKTGGK